MFRPARAALLLLTLLALGACMPPTRAIGPAFIDPRLYAGVNCQQLVALRARAMRGLTFSGLAQDQLHRDDHIRTFGAPTPMATIFDESREPDVSALKGELLALNERLTQMDCLIGDK